MNTNVTCTTSLERTELTVGQTLSNMWNMSHTGASRGQQHRAMTIIHVHNTPGAVLQAMRSIFGEGRYGGMQHEGRHAHP